MNKTFIIIGGIVLVIALLAGSFYGGVAYQSSVQTRNQAAFFTQRGFGVNGTPEPGFGLGGTPQPGGARGGFGGGATGSVKSINGNTLQISTAQDVTTVNLDDSTRIEKSAPATTSDLQVGLRVTVTGQRDANGVITASQILIISTGQ
jgi:hypothetical protein